MLWIKALVIVGGAVWLSLMELAVLLPAAPQLLRFTRPFILPPDWKIEVTRVKSSYHRPGETGLVVMGVGPYSDKDVKTQALLVLWGFLFLTDLFTVAVAVFALWR
ncbi:MAG: hypothetical protein V2J07_07640 [Anaerolineae bacterium]|jgi:hypothetical protein|nr:hypothetical protein [Anaerolineae bacterium]